MLQISLHRVKNRQDVNVELLNQHETKHFKPWMQSRSYLGSVSGAVAVREDALAGVALWRRVGVLLDGAGGLVGAVLAVAGVAVAEERLLDAVAVAALEEALGAHGLVRLEVGPGDPRAGEAVAVVNLHRRKDV